MTVAENGRYCLSCDKVVVDFSKMTDQEIRSYFLRNAGKKCCGYFRSEQVASGARGKLWSRYYSNFRNGQQRSVLGIAAMLIALLGLLVSGCKQHTATTGEVSVDGIAQPDSANSDKRCDK